MPAPKTAEEVALLRRDTPVEVPVLSASPPGALAELETLERLYDDWSAVRAEQLRSLHAVSEERQALTQQGELLLGAVAVARSLTAGSGDPGAQARLKLDEALAALEARAALGLERLDEAARAARQRVLERVERQARLQRPELTLMIRTLSSGARILHAGRVEGDAAALLLHALSGRVPSRHAFATDDQVDDPRAEERYLYAEEGLGDASLSGEPLLGVLDALVEVWPVKACLPFVIPPVEGLARRLARWRARGAVMELELAEGAGFRSILSRTEAEAVAGALLALQLEGKLEVTLAP